LTGTATAALPLKAWHPYGEVQALEGTPTQAVLDVQIYPSTTAQTTAKLVDGSAMQQAATTAMPPETLHAGPKPLP
jgi:hypothetical protein